MKLYLKSQRLLRVQIENDHAVNVIERYDSEETLFYCDPPYPHSSRGDSRAYRYEMTDYEHVELSRTLKSVKGKVALSGYHCNLLDDLYGDWATIEAPAKRVHSVKTERVQVLWVNYDISAENEIQWQMTLQKSFV